MGGKTTKTETILSEAAATIEDRQKRYGTPKLSFEKTAALWSAYLGIEIRPDQVCMCMALLKISRESFVPMRDNRVDICGYVQVADICLDE